MKKNYQLPIFEYFEQIFGNRSTYAHRIDRFMRLLFFPGKSMTPQEFLAKLATAPTDPEKLVIFAEYLDTNALDYATTPKWRSLSYSNEIEMALKNVAFHLEALAEVE
jgi:hypothetical protein